MTDAALSQLDIDSLLKELLDRLCVLLSSDVAAIMLVDADAQQLVTAAAVGLEEEVRQGFRIDIGAGFAGRVAQTGAPLCRRDCPGSKGSSWPPGTCQVIGWAWAATGTTCSCCRRVSSGSSLVTCPATASGRPW